MQPTRPPIISNDPILFLFYPQGRINRLQFLLGAGLLLANQLLIMSIAGPAPILALGLVGMGVLSGIAIYTKRLHDLGMSGWWQSGFRLAALVGLILVMMAVARDPNLLQVMQRAPDDPMTREEFNALPQNLVTGLAFFNIAALIWLVQTLWLAARQGNPQPNRFGPPS